MKKKRGKKKTKRSRIVKKGKKVNKESLFISLSI